MSRPIKSRLPWLGARMKWVWFVALHESAIDAVRASLVWEVRLSFRLRRHRGCAHAGAVWLDPMIYCQRRLNDKILI